jgi:hypothetical protein
MAQKIKVGRNDLCPCLSGLKYKKCCEGKTLWPEILRGDVSDSFTNLSARGKNIFFLHAIAGALQLDKVGPQAEWKDIKR